MSERWSWLVVPGIYRLEWIYLGALILLSCLLPRRSSILGCANRAVRWLGTRRRASILTTMLVVLIGRLALMGGLGIPRPGVPDEFGYLLTADTFAHGRMSNPTPPNWKPLESFHVIQTPTYQSQYPIGYPAVLALGKVAFGNSWWGVYLATALMCGAITWMLQAWLPPYWALLGGLLVAIRVGLFSYWINSFWGGSLAALGGALVFGALPRITDRLQQGLSRNVENARPVLGPSILLALGLAILASTRPFEGVVLCLPVAAVFFYWLASQRGERLRHALRHAAAPVIVLLGITAAITLYYQFKVTGHALESPYSVAMRQFHPNPPFVFQKARPTPHYDYVELRFVYLHYEAPLQDPYEFLHALNERMTWYWKFYVGPLMTLPLLASMLALRDSRLRFAWISLMFLAAAVLLENWVHVHYAAPGFCLLVLMLLEGARRLKVLSVKRYAVGAHVVRVLPVVCVLMLALRVFAFNERCDYWPPTWAYATQRLYDRERIEDKLSDTPGQHLVFVRYRYPFHNFHHELVFNGADLAGSKILWARSADAKQNCAFAQQYSGRTPWIFDEWGDVVRFLPATQAEICDPSNPVYQANEPESHYYHKRTSAPPQNGSDQFSHVATVRVTNSKQ